MSEVKEKIKSKWFAKFLTKKIITFVAIGVLVLAVILGTTTALRTDNKVTKLGFEDIGELATQSAHYTQVAVMDKDRKLFTQSIPFTKTHYIFSYDGEIKAGFEFSEIDWKENEKEKSITVKLPKAKVLSNELDEESLKIYLEENSPFSNIGLKEQAKNRKKMQEDAEKAAIENGLLEEATENAKTILNGFFAKEYDLKEYKIIYKTTESKGK